LWEVSPPEDEIYNTDFLLLRILDSSSDFRLPAPDFSSPRARKNFSTSTDVRGDFKGPGPLARIIDRFYGFRTSNKNTGF
jgi:hypothetical protein